MMPAQCESLTVETWYVSILPFPGPVMRTKRSNCSIASLTFRVWGSVRILVTSTLPAKVSEEQHLIWPSGPHFTVTVEQAAGKRRRGNTLLLAGIGAVPIDLFIWLIL